MKKKLIAITSSLFIATIFLAPVSSVFAQASGSGAAGNPVVTVTTTSGSDSNTGVSTGMVSGIQCKLVNFKSIVICLSSLINTAVPIIIALTVLFIVWNIFKLIRSGDGENLKGIKDIIMWGVIGLFCMLSIWGFVAILSNTVQFTNTPIQPAQFTLPSTTK
jgi:hypothetical protein